LPRRTHARFIGALRLVPAVDSIGVPLFQAVRGNEMFVPEMDGDFRVRQFTEFYNEDNYAIEYDIPRDFLNQRFSVGSPTPIPFWISNKMAVIQGDADKDEPIKQFGPNALSNQVLADLCRLLDEARSGKINDRMKEWDAENIANGFGDVFFETPVRSRYWVTRYRVAVARARKLTQPPHPIDNKLRLVAGEWFRRFGNKTNLGSLCGMLGTSASQIFSKRQITDIMFSFLVNKLAYRDVSIIDEYAQERSIHGAFPSGLYGHFIEHGWPRVPFEYTRVENFTDVMQNALLEGMEQENFRRASRLSLLLYGQARAPAQIETLAGTYLMNVGSDFQKLRRQAKDVFKMRMYAEEWPSYAETLLDYYDQMMDLDGIINPEDRGRRKPFNNRFGVPSAYLNDLKKIKARDW
jgi:hypothetical protein